MATRQFSLEEVKACGPDSSGPILVSILGIVYDCSVNGGRDFFGPDGPYRVFAGHDATLGLARMDLGKKSNDTFQYELDQEDTKTLADWIAYFDVKYGRIGLLKERHQHPISPSDLPKGKDPSKLIATSHPAVGEGVDQAQKAAFHKVVSAGSSEPEASSAKGVTTSNPPSSSSDLVLSRRLIQETNDLHERLIRGAFMQNIMQRAVLAPKYAAWIACLYHIYTELESHLEESAVLVQDLDDMRLRRLPNIEEDLAHFYGPNWRALLPSPSLHTIRYVARISEIADQPHRLAVHHWMRYGAGLAGGQFIKVALKGGLKLKSTSTGVSPGLRYHEFERLGDSRAVQAFYEKYLVSLDGLQSKTDQAQRSEMIEEARFAFELNLKLNEEFDETPRM